MNSYIKQITNLVDEIIWLAKKENKMTGFTIGNTAKVDQNGIYLTPLRNTMLMVTAGVIVYSEQQAIDIAEMIDGKIEYILVDAEKKIADAMSLSGEPSNVERAVREKIKKSNLWVYKGNDLSVEAVDDFISLLTKDDLKGIGDKKIAILGAGNLGCKLALKIVERGGHVYIYRRNKEKLKIITEALNYIKPLFTTAEIIASSSNEAAAKNADIVIGVSQGIPVITPEIIRSLSPGALVVDVGKGTLHDEAIDVAGTLNIDIYRLNIDAAFEGLISKLWATENILKDKLGRCEIEGETIVSGGLLGRNGEIVVDNIHNITAVYGIANGNGDFIRSPTEEQMKKIKKIQEYIESDCNEFRHVKV